MLFLFLSAAATAQNWYDDNNLVDGNCKRIAGVYQFVETVNEYDNSEVGSLPFTIECAGGVGFLVVYEDCTWELKRIKNDPDNFCEADRALSGQEIQAEQLEFFTIKSDWSAGYAQSVIGNEIRDFVFSIERVPGVTGDARRIQGVLERFNGCDIGFEGWAVQREGVSQCITGYNNGQYRDSNIFKKRHAQLTSEDTSSVSVSDIKDALALIANAIPDFGDTSDSHSASTSDSDDDDFVPCGDFAGVYQIVETVNEYDGSEFYDAADDTGSAHCNGGVAYLDIHPGCGWSYKKVSVGVHKTFLTDSAGGTYFPVGIAATPVYDCIDDSGVAENGVQEYEGEFCKIIRTSNDNVNGDFRFAIDRIEGSDHAAVRISGVVERNRDLAVGGGCDVSFEGFRIERPDITPCKDRCYSANNGNFEEGYDGFSSAASRAIGTRYGQPIGGPGYAEYAVTTNPRVANIRFDFVPCDGFCLVTSVDGGNTSQTPAYDTYPILWFEFFQHVGDPACCESQQYIIDFKARNVGQNSDGDTIQVAYQEGTGAISVGTFATLKEGFTGPGATEVAPSSTEWSHYRSTPIPFPSNTGGAFYIVGGGTTTAYSDTDINAFAFDDIFVYCASPAIVV